MELTLTLPDSREIKLKNVPEDITASSFISSISKLQVIQDLGFPVQLEGVDPRSFLVGGTYTLIERKDKVNYFGQFFLWICFISTFCVPGLVYYLSHNFRHTLFSYIASCIVYGVICTFIKPRNIKLDETLTHQRFGIVFEVIILFFRTMLPTFRMEELVL